MTKLSFLAVAIVVSAAAGVAHGAETIEKPSAKLGDPGSVSIALEGSTGNPTHRQDVPVMGADFVVRPQVDVFVARRVSIGGSLPIELRIPSGAGATPARLVTAFPILRFGVTFPIGRRVSIWPGLQGGCGWDNGLGHAPACRAFNQLWVGLDARVAVEIVPHAYVSIAPLVARVRFDEFASERGTLGPVMLSSNLALSAVF